MTHVGKRLRELRTRAGLKREELAVEAGVSYGVVAMIEASNTTDPKVSTLRKLARALARRQGKREMEVLAELLGEEEAAHEA